MGKRFNDLSIINENKEVKFEMGWKLFNSAPHLYDEVAGLLIQADVGEIIRKEGRFNVQVTRNTRISGYTNIDYTNSIIDVLVTDVHYSQNSRKKEKII